MSVTDFVAGFPPGVSLTEVASGKVFYKMAIDRAAHVDEYSLFEAYEGRILHLSELGFHEMDHEQFWQQYCVIGSPMIGRLEV